MTNSSIEAAVLEHLLRYHAIGLECYRWKATLTWFVLRASPNTSGLVVTRTDQALKTFKETRAVPLKSADLDGISLAYVAPHDLAHDVPAHLLRTQDGRPLGEGRSVLTVRKLSDLARPNSRKAGPVWAFVDTDARELLPGGGSLLINNVGRDGIVVRPNSSADALLEQSSRFPVVIWYCHGGWAPSGGTTDYLELGPGARLTTSDLRRTRLRFEGSEILVLACQRKPQARVGDRRVGFGPLFYELGANLVISTLRPIQDSRVATNLALEYLYARREGDPPWRAWQRALLEARWTAERFANGAAPTDLYSSFVAYGKGAEGA